MSILNLDELSQRIFRICFVVVYVLAVRVYAACRSAKKGAACVGPSC